MLPGGLRQPISQPSSALSTRIAAKKAELENLRQLRDLSGTLAMQMQALESKVSTLKDGTEGTFFLFFLLSLHFLPNREALLFVGFPADLSQRLHVSLPIGTMSFAPSVSPPVSLSDAYQDWAIVTNAVQNKLVDFTIPPVRTRHHMSPCQPLWFASPPSSARRLANEPGPPIAETNFGVFVPYETFFLSFAPEPLTHTISSGDSLIGLCRHGPRRLRDLPRSELP